MEWTYYCDVFGGWRWECRGPDGEVRDSQHSYDTRQECMEAAALFRASAMAQHAASESAARVLPGVAKQDELRKRTDIAAGRAKHSRKAAAEALRDRAREAFDGGGPLVTFDQNRPETIRKLAAKRDRTAA